MEAETRPLSHASVAMDLAMGWLLGAAVALVAEGRAHTIALVTRTVRDADDATSLALGAVAGFSSAALVLLAPRRGSRSWVQLLLPPLVAVGAVLAGRREAVGLTEYATPALTMAQRSDALALAFVRAAGFFALGALAAGMLLATSAIIVAWRTRPSSATTPDRRRTLALAVGLLAVPIVATVLLRHGRSAGWLGASPCAVGVLAVFFAGPGRTSVDEPERRAAAAGVAGAMLLTVAAVLCTAVACGLVAAVGLGEDGPSEANWNAVVSMWRGRFLAECGGTAWFVAPVVLASLVALPARDWLAGVAAAKMTGACASLAVAAAVVAPFALRGPAAALAGFGPTRTPAGFDLPAAPSGNDCRAMPEDAVVFVGADRVWHGGVDVGPARVLDDAPSCAAFASAELPPSSSAWLSVDESTTFARLGCLLGALAGPRGESVPPGRSGRWRWSLALALPASPCQVHWVGHATSGSAEACGALTLAHPYCYGQRPDPDEKIEPEPVFDVVMVDHAAFHLRVLRSTKAYEAGLVPRVLEKDGEGHAEFPELARAMRKLWHASGNHFAEADRRFDFALLHAAPDTPMVEVEAALDAVLSIERDVSLGDHVESLPVFDVGVALPDPRSRP